MSDTYLEETDALEEDTQRGKYLTFAIGEEFYGLEIRCVTEIIKVQPITTVPEVPDYIIGIINLRGQIIPVMDIRVRFNMATKVYTDRTCIVVIDIDDMPIGLIVDSVSEVLSIADDDIVAPPEFTRERNRYVEGIGKVGGDVKLLLNAKRLIREDDKKKVMNIQ